MTQEAHIKSDVALSVVVKDYGGKGWFRLWRSVVDAGHLKAISGSAAKVLIAIARYANNEWQAWPGARLICDQTGICLRSYRRAVAELQKAGILHQIDGGSGGLDTSRWLVKNARSGAVSRATGVTPPRATGVTPPPFIYIDELEINTTTTGEEKKSGGVDGICLMLMEAGINDPVRSELMAADGISLSLVRSVVTKAREGGAKTGAIVRSLQTALAAKAAKKAAASFRPAPEPAPKVAREDVRELVEATIGGLPIGELEKLRDEVVRLAPYGERVAARMAKMDVQSAIPLRVEMARLFESRKGHQ